MACRLFVVLLHLHHLNTCCDQSAPSGFFAFAADNFDAEAGGDWKQGWRLYDLCHLAKLTGLSAWDRRRARESAGRGLPPAPAQGCGRIQESAYLCEVVLHSYVSRTQCMRAGTRRSARVSRSPRKKRARSDALHHVLRRPHFPQSDCINRITFSPEPSRNPSGSPSRCSVFRRA